MPHGGEKDRINRKCRSEINLHPFGGVVFFLDGTVITERAIRERSAGWRERCGSSPKYIDLLIYRGNRRRGHAFDFLIERGQRGFQTALLLRQLRSSQSDGRISVIRPVSPADAGEISLQTVIVLLGDRIELVIVAAGAVNGQGGKRRHGVHHHVVAVEVADDRAVTGIFRDFDLPHRVPRPRGDEAGGDDAIGICREKHVPGKLLLHETRIGFVLIERADDVVAIRPGVGAGSCPCRIRGCRRSERRRANAAPTVRRSAARRADDPQDVRMRRERDR